MGNSTKLKIALLITIAVIVSVSLFYFFIWRTSDTDYKTASDQLSTVISAKSDISSKVDSIQTSVNVDDDLVSSLEKSTSQYNASLSLFSKGAVATRDTTVKNSFEQNKKVVADYDTSVTNLVSSLKKYRLILTTCSELVKKIDTFTSASGFDQSATDCKKTITAAKSASYKPFNEQFLTKYASRSNDLVEAYRNQVEIKIATKAKSISQDSVLLTLVKEKVNELSENKLDLTPTPDPSDALKKLSDIVTSQKAVIFR